MDAGVSSRLDNTATLVGRGIVDYEDLNVRPALLDDRFETATDVVFPVERRYDDRKEGTSTLVRHASSIYTGNRVPSLSRLVATVGPTRCRRVD